MQMSIGVGRYDHQLDGKKSRVSEVTMISNRSNHIPMFANIATVNTTARFVRIFLIHRICGEIALQKIMIQNDHA